MERRKDIDGGFAWLILCASFTVMFLTGMLIYSTGVINTAILEEVDNDIFRTSWIGSTMLGTSTLCGPLTGLLTKLFGYRVSCFCGGILILIGLAAASFVNDVTGLIITYGIITGFGMGMTINSSQAVPGYYFHRRRGLAFGVSASGAGIGIFAAGPLARMLLEKYRLRGCLLIFGSISSNICVAACLLRPASSVKAQRQQSVEGEMCVPLHGSNVEMIKTQNSCILADAELSTHLILDIEQTESKLDVTVKDQNDTEKQVEIQSIIERAQTTSAHGENVSWLGKAESDLDHEALYSEDEQALSLEYVQTGTRNDKDHQKGFSISR